MCKNVLINNVIFYIIINYSIYLIKSVYIDYFVYNIKEF